MSNKETENCVQLIVRTLVTQPSIVFLEIFKMINGTPSTQLFFSIMLFWVKSTCGIVGKNQLFGEACCIHLQG
jgi:hypothetical protein